LLLGAYCSQTDLHCTPLLAAAARTLPAAVAAAGAWVSAVALLLHLGMPAGSCNLLQAWQSVVAAALAEGWNKLYLARCTL
jgi:hypothetical protein